jgi:alkylhydroperoxidase/carboxymuconolactone decarboxylase family protein YurZ
MTHRDKFLLKLIDVSDRELANIYCLYINDCRDCHFVGVKGCFDKLVDWIKQECESNERL